MWDLRALRSPFMRAKKPRSVAVHEMRGFLSRCSATSTSPRLTGCWSGRRRPRATASLKSQDQRTNGPTRLHTLHCSRDRLVGERTGPINQLRAILLERGIVVPQGKRKLEQFLVGLMDDQDGSGLSPRMILLVADARAQRAWRKRLVFGMTMTDLLRAAANGP